MSVSLDKVFGVPAAALKLQSQRVQLIGENIANADTPEYKARDIDFRAALAGAGSDRASLATTNARHIPAAGDGRGGGEQRVQYRVPANPSLDGNTVEVHREQTRFAETSVQYQAAVNLLGSRIQGIIGALKGE
ncbi:flagellar basal body rod protein FlgB [Arhodomonas sp. AD133]|uniref:flagellar basal body rod protein FlgB n=1 Tax=Arhodomonas sp. AD133 TaxID=3415009 RepID=UPI003EB8865D